MQNILSRLMWTSALKPIFKKYWKLTEKSTKNRRQITQKIKCKVEKKKFNKIFFIKCYFQLKYQPIAKKRFRKNFICFKKLKKSKIIFGKKFTFLFKWFWVKTRKMSFRAFFRQCFASSQLVADQINWIRTT